MELMEHKEKQEQMDQTEHKVKQEQMDQDGSYQGEAGTNGSAGATAAEAGSKWI
jgi:hypothetical protein